MFVKYNDQGDILGFALVGWEEGQDKNGNYIKEFHVSSVDPDLHKVVFLEENKSGSVNLQRRTDTEVDEVKLEQQQSLIRPERNKRLAESDIKVLKYIERGETVPSQWVTYRDELRDLTDNITVGTDVVWPTKPEDD